MQFACTQATKSHFHWQATADISASSWTQYGADDSGHRVHQRTVPAAVNTTDPIKPMHRYALLHLIMPLKGKWSKVCRLPSAYVSSRQYELPLQCKHQDDLLGMVDLHHLQRQTCSQLGDTSGMLEHINGKLSVRTLRKESN